MKKVQYSLIGLMCLTLNTVVFSQEEKKEGVTKTEKELKEEKEKKRKEMVQETKLINTSLPEKKVREYPTMEEGTKEQ